MRTNPGFIAGVAVLVLSLAYAPAIAASPLADNPFIAMCTGTKDAAHDTPASQVGLVKALGYSGTDLIGVTGLAEVLGEIDRQESRFFALYTGGNIDPGATPWEEGLEEASGRPVFACGLLRYSPGAINNCMAYVF